MIPFISDLKTYKIVLDIIYGCICINTMKIYLGMINLKTRMVTGSDKRGKWDQEELYMRISTVS